MSLGGVSVPNYNQLYFIQILNKEEKPIHVNKQYSLNSLVLTCACVRARAKEWTRGSTPPALIFIGKNMPNLTILGGKHGRNCIKILEGGGAEAKM